MRKCSWISILCYLLLNCIIVIRASYEDNPDIVRDIPETPFYQDTTLIAVSDAGKLHKGTTDEKSTSSAGNDSNNVQENGTSEQPHETSPNKTQLITNISSTTFFNETLSTPETTKLDPAKESNSSTTSSNEEKSLATSTSPVIESTASTLNNTETNLTTPHLILVGEFQNDFDMHFTNKSDTATQSSSTFSIDNETTSIAQNLTAPETKSSSLINALSESIIAVNDSINESNVFNSTNLVTNFETESENTSDPFLLVLELIKVLDQNGTETLGENFTKDVVPILDMSFENQTTLNTSKPDNGFLAIESLNVTENSTSAFGDTANATVNYTSADTTIANYTTFVLSFGDTANATANGTDVDSATVNYTTIAPTSKNAKNATYEQNKIMKTMIFKSTTSPTTTTNKKTTTSPTPTTNKKTTTSPMNTTNKKTTTSPMKTTNKKTTTETKTTVTVATSPRPNVATTIFDSSTVSKSTRMMSTTTRSSNPIPSPLPKVDAISGVSRDRICKARWGITIFVLTKIVIELFDLF